jgi:hypothetical protein
MRPLRAIFEGFEKFFFLKTKGCKDLLGPTPFFAWSDPIFTKLSGLFAVFLSV